MAQCILNILISCMYRTNGVHQMHRLMCIFVISRFQTTFSHEMTVVSEIYCQNLKDKTSILSLGQTIKMCYCRIHAHVHAWTEPWLDTFFSTNGELSYKSNKNAWAYSETRIDLWVSLTGWSRFSLLITASVSAQSDHFRCLLNGIKNVLKTHGLLIQAANTLIAHDGCSGWPMCLFLVLIKINMLLNHFHLGWNQVGTARSRW